MDEKRKLELLNQSKIIYESATGCMPGLERWAESFKGTEEYLFASGFYDFVNRKNTRDVSTRVFGLGELDFKEFLNSLPI
ncbi:MAG: hypothetical protein WC584_03410 [Candidatus Pacearchaeota archaeon]